MTLIRTQAANSCLRPVEQDFLNLVNNHRASIGVAPVRASKILGATATDKTLDFLYGKPGVYGPYFNHISPDGVKAEQNKINHGYPPNSPGWGEIIAWGHNAAQSAFNSFMGSTDHRNEIQNPVHKEIGIGGGYGVQFQDSYWGVWTAVFGSASTSQAGACGTTPPPDPEPEPSGPDFDIGDRVRVTDGPLNLRSAPGTSSSIVTSLATGAELCVIGGPSSGNGYEWYQVRLTSGSTQGWAASAFLGLIQAQGCVTTPPPTGPTPITTSGITAGDVLYVSDPPLNMRASPSTSAAIIATLPLNAKGVVVSGPVSANGYTWYQFDTAQGRGWAVAQFMTETSSFINYLANPGAGGSLAGIVANAASTSLSRVQVNSDYVARATNAGSAAYEGVRYESNANLNLAGQRMLEGVADVYGSGQINLAIVRVRYTDGSFSDSASAPAQNLSGSAWSRIVVPATRSLANKTIAKIELHLVRTTVAGSAWTLNVDNAKVIEI